jgi:hypothetical protein
VIVSAMQSREFGWGEQLTDDQLKQVNAQGVNDKDYLDTIAAIDSLACLRKRDSLNHHL